MGRREKLLLGAAGLAAAVWLAGCKTSVGNAITEPNEEGVYTIRLTSPTYSGEATHEGIEKFKELAEEYSGGRLEIKHYDSTQLGSDRDTAEQVQQGALEAACCSSSNFVSIVPAFYALELPYVTSKDKIEPFNESLDNGELGAFFEEKLNEAGFQPVMYNMFGYRVFYTNEGAPFTGVDSFQGIKLRTTESPVEMATVQALGAFAMPLAWADTITAIEQNTVNGWGTTDSYAKNCGAYEIVNNAIDSEHCLSLQIVVMNKEYYDSLPEDLQEIVTRAGKEATVYEREYEAQMAEQDRETMKELGINYYVLSNEEREQMKEITRSTWDELMDTEDKRRALELILETQQ